MKHFTTIDISLKSLFFSGSKTSYCFNEESFDIFRDSGAHIWEYKKEYLYGTYGAFEEAQEIFLSENKDITKAELLRYRDDFEDNVLNALDNAYRDNCEYGFYNDAKEHCESLASACNASGFYFINDKELKCELYDATYLRLYFTKKDFDKHILPDCLEYYTKADIYHDKEHYAAEHVNQYGGDKPFDWEHFDYHGTRFDSAGWGEILKEYEETSLLIREERKQYQNKIKEAIKSKAPIYAKLRLKQQYSN